MKDEWKITASKKASKSCVNIYFNGNRFRFSNGITLYSFRHTGAIKVFEKTGSPQKLQQVMGHSDMKVSLTYLRGLEVKQLDVEDCQCCPK